MVNTAVYLHNRIPNRKDKCSPYENFYGKKPRVSHLKIIGSTTFVGISRIQRTKWNNVSWIGTLVGYGDSIKFYRVYNPETQAVQLCKDVKIIENNEEEYTKETLNEDSFNIQYSMDSDRGVERESEEKTKN
jgi:hypothetical protein